MFFKRFKPVLINISLIIVSIIIALIIGEVVVRFIFPEKHLSRFQFQVSKYLDVVYEYKPNLDYVSPSQKMRITINSEGFRDREFNLSKDTNLERIIFLGDSATYGHRIKDINDTLPKQLEQILNKKANKHYEVFNMGVEGYNTHHEMGVLKHKAIKFSPDIVILALNFGDALHDFIKVSGDEVVGDPYYKPFIGQILPSGLYSILLNNSMLFYKTENVLSNIFYSKENKKNFRTAFLDMQKDSETSGNKLYDLSLLKQMNDICKKNNAKFIVAIMPWFNIPVDKNSTERVQLEMLKKDLDGQNILYIDLFEPILYENNHTDLNSIEYTEALKVSSDDNHPNEKALKIYAEEISKKIVE